MEVLLGKSSVNGPFSIAMLIYQRVKQQKNIRQSSPYMGGIKYYKMCLNYSQMDGENYCFAHIRTFCVQMSGWVETYENTI